MHRCPGGCNPPVSVTSDHLACRACWFRLPKVYRDAVWEGYREGPLSGTHIAGMLAARTWWLANPPTQPS